MSHDRMKSRKQNNVSIGVAFGRKLVTSEESAVDKVSKMRKHKKMDAKGRPTDSECEKKEGSTLKHWTQRGQGCKKSHYMFNGRTPKQR